MPFRSNQKIYRGGDKKGGKKKEEDRKKTLGEVLPDTFFSLEV